MNPIQPFRGAGIVLVRMMNNTPHCLVVQNKASHLWSFPKGRRENNEAPFETAVRELQEETGLHLFSLSFRIVASMNTEQENYYRYYGIIVSDTNELCPSIDRHDEIEDAQWIPLHQLSTIRCNAHIKRLRTLFKTCVKHLSIHG